MEKAGAERAVSSVAVGQTETAAPPYRRSRAKVIFYRNRWVGAFYTCFCRGGFLIVSKSEWGWWPHVMWSPDLKMCHQFEPDHKRLRRRLHPPLIDCGYIKTTRL
jgi:hypothetical protein